MVHQGGGVYATPNGMMTTRTSFAGGGTLDFPALDPESYFTGKVNANLVEVAAALGAADKKDALAKVDLELVIDRQGPGFGLLGIAPDEIKDHRVHVTPKRLADAIGAKIQVADRIDVKDDKGGTTIHYVLEGTPRLVKDVVDSKAVPMKLTSVTATRAATGQSIRITSWDMAYRGDAGQVLDGSIALDVDGGAFPYSVRFTYPHRTEPDVDVRCR
jgi:hypothetical protein